MTSVDIHPEGVSTLPPAFYGEWRVAYTTLAFWKGKTDGYITYTPLADGRAGDRVCYRHGKGTALKEILGVDTPQGLAGAFQWRGKGLLCLITSRWQLIYIDLDYAITAFASTLFTAAGMDIYVRKGVVADPARIPELIAAAEKASPNFAGAFFPIPTTTTPITTD